MSEKDNETNKLEEQMAEQEENLMDAETDAAVQDDDMAAKLAQSEARAQDNWEQLLRTKAEMDNLRRRTERELENAHKYALERFSQELLPVKDSLEMGVSVARTEGAELANLLEGTELTLKMLNTVMEKFAIKEINPLDEPFDPELHQAMSMLESPDKAPNTVINVMQKGYTLNDRLIRPAMVVVSKAGGNETTQDSGTNVDGQA